MVTNLKQKSQDVKRHRRTRYKRACKPIMKKFNCTAMQVAGVVEQLYGENIALRDKVEKLNYDLRKLREEIELMKQVKAEESAKKHK